MKNGGVILVGTASWTDRSLLDAGWYPRGASSAEARLAYYASRFPFVEVDSTYYFLPPRATAEAWAERTPSGFTFDVKAFSLLTQHPTRPEALPEGMAPAGKRHVYLRHLDERAVDEIWERFLVALAPLEETGKLGTILLQFPPWFSAKRSNRDYLVQCAERTGGLPVAVEFRHASWLRDDQRDETFALLAKHDMTYVCVDTARRRDAVPPVAVVTCPRLAVVRFHGRGGGATGNARSAARYSYTKKALASWLPKLQALAEQAEVVHAVFRNVHRDFAARSAERLQALLADAGVEPAGSRRRGTSHGVAAV